MNANILVLIFGGAGLFGFLGTLIALWVNRNKNKAEVESLIAETEKKRLEAQGEMQDQLFELIEQNKKLFVERETQREAKEKLRTELNRLHDGLDLLRRELQTERDRNVQLIKQLDAQRAGSLEKTIKIEGLEALVAQHEITIAKFSADLGQIKSVTGHLTAQRDKRY